MSKVAFIGLGNMGAPMASNLVKSGFNVSVFDLNKDAINTLVSEGATSGSTAQDTASDADIVITMLPAASHVNAVYFDEEFGIASVLKSDAIVIDCSTIDAATAKSLGARLNSQGIQFIDAPVSGGVGGAKAGTLTFMIGGQVETLEQARPLFESMGKNIFHAGSHIGSGQLAKICNNMLLAVLMAGTSEALQLAIDNGLDPKVISQIMQQSSGNNWTLQTYNPCPGVMDSVPSSNDYNGGFMVKLMNKDLGLAMDAANISRSSTPMGSLAQSLFQLHEKQGFADKDFSSIFTLFSESGAQQ